MWKKEGETPTVEKSTGDRGGKNGEISAFVGKGVEFKGTINYEGTVRIDGRMEGEIQTGGVLIIGEEAVITAKVQAGTVVSKGRITGDVVARERVKLMSPAVLRGSVQAPVFSIEEGVTFDGSCEMSRGRDDERSQDQEVHPVAPQGGAVKRMMG